MAGMEGDVWIKVLVDTTGKVIKRIIHKTSGNRSLDEAAADIAYKYKFNSGSLNGTKIEMWFTYKVSFLNGNYYFYTRNGVKR